MTRLTLLAAALVIVAAYSTESVPCAFLASTVRPGSPAGVPTQTDVAACPPPHLVVTPTSLTDTTSATAAAHLDTLFVLNEGWGAMDWRAVLEQPATWLALQSDSGTGGGILLLRLDPTGLSGTVADTVIVALKRFAARVSPSLPAALTDCSASRFVVGFTRLTMRNRRRGFPSPFVLAAGLRGFVVLRDM